MSEPCYYGLNAPCSNAQAYLKARNPNWCFYRESVKYSHLFKKIGVPQPTIFLDNTFKGEAWFDKFDIRLFNGETEAPLRFTYFETKGNLNSLDSLHRKISVKLEGSEYDCKYERGNSNPPDIVKEESLENLIAIIPEFFKTVGLPPPQNLEIKPDRTASYEYDPKHRPFKFTTGCCSRTPNVNILLLRNDQQWIRLTKVTKNPLQKPSV